MARDHAFDNGQGKDAIRWNFQQTAVSLEREPKMRHDNRTKMGGQRMGKPWVCECGVVNEVDECGRGDEAAREMRWVRKHDRFGGEREREQWERKR